MAIICATHTQADSNVFEPKGFFVIFPGRDSNITELDLAFWDPSRWMKKATTPWQGIVLC